MQPTPETNRLDLELVNRGLAESRTRATRLIQSGGVRVDSRVVLKPGRLVGPESSLEVTALDRWVSRAANKLLFACEKFGLSFTDRVVLDVGASTGGFTEVALARGAKRVIALDVGHGQIHPTIRANHRVTVVEGQNVRDLSTEIVSDWGAGAIDDVVADVSFISLDKVVPALISAIGADFRYVFLVKPQFEVGKGNLKEGIVRDEAKRNKAVSDVCEMIASNGLPISGLVASPTPGESGNLEAIVHGDRKNALDAREWRDLARSVFGG